MEETVKMLSGALFPPATDPWELQVEGPLLVPWYLKSSAPLERKGEAGRGAIRLSRGGGRSPHPTPVFGVSTLPVLLLEPTLCL